MAIELETTNNPKRDDIWKIEGMTMDGGEYSYRLGLFVVFGVEKKAGQIISKEWYKNGQIVSPNVQ